MADFIGRLIYFLGNPSEFIGLWLLDVTVLVSSLTLLVVLRQLFVTKRQMDIILRQDELNRALVSRRARLVLYAQPAPPGQLVVFCRNDGNRTAQNFQWHLSIPITVGASSVWNSSGRQRLCNGGMESHQRQLYRHYQGQIDEPLYPAGVTPIARIATDDMALPLWWCAFSDDGADPAPDGTMQKMQDEAQKP